MDADCNCLAGRHIVSSIKDLFLYGRMSKADALEPVTRRPKEVLDVKKGICFSCLPASVPVQDRLQLAKEAGIEGIEIPQFETREQVEEVAEIAADVGIEIHSVMGGTHWQLPLSSTDEEVRVQGVEGIKRALHVAKWSGAPVVLVVPGVVTEDVSYAAAMELSRKSLYEILPTAEELGVAMLLENVWNKFLLSPLEMREYIDSFETPLIQAYFDVGNILLYGYPHQWIEILGERIKRVHVKDFDVNTRQFVALLTGSVDWPRVANALRGIGYDSYVTAEVAGYKHAPETFVRHVGLALEAIVRA
jgi:L-ribulose-5-phosphate 3-epimerase